MTVTSATAVATDLITDQRTCGRAADGADRATENGIAHETTSHSAYTSADLAIGGVRRATGHDERCCASQAGSDDANVFHVCTLSLVAVSR